jgi:osmotically-inducible protein OsmY
MISFPRNSNVPLKLVPETDADQELELRIDSGLGCVALATEAVDNEAETNDRDLKTRVVSYLAGCHMPGLRQLAVEAHNGVVTITGRVKTYYEKQLGGQRARRVAGVVQLVDRIDVAVG